MRRYEASKELHEEALKEPVLTFDKALEKAEMMYPKEKDPKKLGKIVNELQMNDILGKAGIARSRISVEFLELLDMANARRLIQPSEDKIRKLAECEQKKTVTEKQLHEAHQRIVELENLVRLLGGDPTPRRDTLTGSVGEGGDSNEHS
jgi:hypothetical protein